MNWTEILKALIKFIITLLGGVLVAQTQMVKQVVNPRTRYVVVQPEGSVGVMSINALGATGANIKEKLTHTEGYVVEASPAQAEEMRDRGLEVYEDRVYTINMGGQCPDNPLPPSPAPIDPSPSPTTDRVPWGTGRIHALEAQARLSGKKVRVCIVDTGADLHHEDLKDVIVGSRSFVPGESAQDTHGHGTHVGGTVAAPKNNRGIAGVAAGVAELYITKALGSGGSGYGSWISDSVRECIRVKSQVINMSLGSPRSGGPDPLISRAVRDAAQAGIHVVMAAGNDGGPVGWPAALAPESPYLHAVSASDQRDRIASFSSRGSEISYIAPGVGIESARAGGGYTSMSGTSMAAPHVAGVMALCVAAGCRELKVERLNLSGSEQGKGLPNALTTVQ